MFDFDFHRMFITIALLGAVIGGATIALVLLGWPWLWALAKPTLHAWTA
jgi:cell division protein FtsX